MLSKSQQKSIEYSIKTSGEHIYHYCSINTFLNMLKTKELWFGWMASMNDKKEQLFFIESLQKNLEPVIPETKKESFQLFFKQIYNNLKHEYSFAFCLSSLRDNAAQWERYGDNAKGICIGFNTEKIATLFISTPILFLPVAYNYPTRLHDHHHVLTEYFLRDNFIKGFENTQQIQENIIACSISHKHESFSTENESRLVNISNHILPKQATITYENIKGNIRKILKVDINSLCEESSWSFEDLIDYIIIGPRSNQSAYELQEYLESIGLHKLSHKISSSNCPLR